jgi:2-polyprenyl-3-methyl-5-hydroxy-6-metoxy-1,4-benzoquinol methylase
MRRDCQAATRLAAPRRSHVKSLAVGADSAVCVKTPTDRPYVDRVFALASISVRDAHAPALSIETNNARNKRHYDRHLRAVAPKTIAEKVRDLESFLDDVTRTDTSWAALYTGGFAARLEGARVLEVGAGDGLNALVMAALGAEVTCVDISEAASPLVRGAAEELGLSGRVRAICGDFAEISLDVSVPFDFVVGKAVLHHLTHEQERACLRKAATMLRPDGEARFAEPAVNSRLLDACRWLIGVPGRPSRLNRAAFRAYTAADPHPQRDNSSAHYQRLGAQFFEGVAIVPIGGLERFERLLPKGSFHRRFRRAALRAEHWLPGRVQLTLARTQTIVLSSPRSLPDDAK